MSGKDNGWYLWILGRANVFRGSKKCIAAINAGQDVGQ